MIERHPGSLVQVQDYITTRKQYFFETKLQSVTNFADVVSEVVVKTCLGLNTVAVWNVYLTIYLTIDPVSYILVTKPLNSFNLLLMVLNEASSISIQRLSSPVIWIRIILLQCSTLFESKMNLCRLVFFLIECFVMI